MKTARRGEPCLLRLDVAMQHFTVEAQMAGCSATRASLQAKTFAEQQFISLLRTVCLPPRRSLRFRRTASKSGTSRPLSLELLVVLPAEDVRLAVFIVQTNFDKAQPLSHGRIIMLSCFECSGAWVRLAEECSLAYSASLSGTISTHVS
jgi:hypothetical protein